uniref:Uncharacterized protein n=1 Tax=Tanacetum cinerariifolium TaxID=118510 RepID=A0A699HMP3_TANCI|nr:hypothetical protein [Tanacetum cinerariifolium]
MSDSEHSTVTYTSISSDDRSLDAESPGEPPPQDFVLELVYPEFMPPKDNVLPAKEQPLPATVSPTADSPGYITETDPKEDPKKEDNEDPGEDPADYPTDRDNDDDEEESSGDDANDEEEDEGKGEEEEHLALADSIPPPVYRTTARMSIRAQTHIPFPSYAEVDVRIRIFRGSATVLLLQSPATTVLEQVTLMCIPYEDHLSYGSWVKYGS